MKRQNADEIVELENELEALRKEVTDRRAADRRTSHDRRQEQTPVIRNGLRMKLWIASGCAALLLPVVAFLETDWRHTVADAMKKVPQIEAATASNASAISELGSELKAQRTETAQFYLFVYQRLGYLEGAQAMKQTLERLGAPAPVIPSPSPAPAASPTRPRPPATLK